MSTNTKIEWTDTTWNPLRGCSRVSEGCRNCYAERQAIRQVNGVYAGLVHIANGHPSWTGKVSFVEDHLLDPLSWKKPRRVFVNSMSDLFHENVLDEWIDKIFAVMALCPQHTFQILTKRPQRMLAYMQMIAGEKDIQRWINAAYDSDPDLSPCAAGLMEDLDWPLPNVWLGVSVENQKAADERIPLLLETPAAVRFISAEPLLGSVEIRQWIGLECRHEDSWSESDTNATVCRECDRMAFLDWVIAGGESGPGARPMRPSWSRSLRDQCSAAGVPFFFKQWGEWAESSAKPIRGEHTGGDLYLLENGHPGNQGDWWDGRAAAVDRIGKKVAGHLLDGVVHHEFPRVLYGVKSNSR